MDVGRLHCQVHSRIVDDRPGYLQRDGGKYEFAKISLKDGDGHNIGTGSYRTNSWDLVVEHISFPTVRDTLWAIRSLTNDEEKGIRKIFLGYDCHVPLRIHLWGSIITVVHKIPAKGEYDLHNLLGKYTPLDSPGSGGITTFTPTPGPSPYPSSAPTLLPTFRPTNEPSQQRPTTGQAGIPEPPEPSPDHPTLQTTEDPAVLTTNTFNAASLPSHVGDALKT